MPAKLHVKTGDTVMVLSGKDAGKRGKVVRALPAEGKVVVEKVNVVVRHQKPRGKAMQGGRLEKEAPVHAAKVMLVCPKCGQPARVGRRVFEDGRRARTCKKCGELVDK